jgi:hypothetical protein
LETLSILQLAVRRFYRDKNKAEVPPAAASTGNRLRLETKGDGPMQFMMIVKHKENQGFPPKELMDAITKLSEESVKAGTLRGNGGLKGTDSGARVVLSQGKVSVLDGPFAESKEIIGGYAQFEMNSKEEAIKSAVEFMELHKKYWPGWEGETEVRQMYGPGDFPCKP